MIIQAHLGDGFSGTKAEGSLRENATVIIIFRGGGFEEIKAQLKPLPFIFQAQT